MNDLAKKKLNVLKNIFGIRLNHLDIWHKDIVWEDGIFTPEEFSKIDEAIKPNFKFGTNSPGFDNGELKKSTWLFTAIKADHLFMVSVDSENVLSFFPVIKYKEGDSLEEMHRNTSIKKLSSIPYTELVKLLGTIVGIILHLLKTNKLTEVKFFGMDRHLVKLYDNVIQSESIKKELAVNRLCANNENNMTVIRKIA